MAEAWHHPGEAASRSCTDGPTLVGREEPPAFRGGPGPYAILCRAFIAVLPAWLKNGRFRWRRPARTPTPIVELRRRSTSDDAIELQNELVPHIRVTTTLLDSASCARRVYTRSPGVKRR